MLRGEKLRRNHYKLTGTQGLSRRERARIRANKYTTYIGHRQLKRIMDIYDVKVD